MQEPVIRVENLSKRYLIGHRKDQGGHTDLREVIRREARNIARKAVDIIHGRQVVQGDVIEDYWALKNVSFDLREGEVLGIIGRNGAGKSTLLKILSRITEPTSGRVILRGRVASLLEVGTGFHPELSGRENVFLNGAILGMSRAEIRKKFDEIVDFAGVETFLDTPVKHYSSGMYVRLAFAIAAHLEPEILIIDEVLAVGDVEFQKKCLGKMNEVARRGRTVLFVSHNIAAIERLSSQAILLKDGLLQAKGETPNVVGTFLRSTGSLGKGWENVENTPRHHPATGAASICKVRIRDTDHVFYGGELIFDIAAKINIREDFIRVSFTIYEQTGTPVGSGFSNETPVSNRDRYVILCTTVSPVRLAPGQYFMSVAIGRGGYQSGYLNYDAVLDCMYFIVGPAPGRQPMLPSWQRAWGSFVMDNVKTAILSTEELDTC